MPNFIIAGTERGDRVSVCAEDYTVMMDAVQAGCVPIASGERPWSHCGPGGDGWRLRCPSDPGLLTALFGQAILRTARSVSAEEAPSDEEILIYGPPIPENLPEVSVSVGEAITKGFSDAVSFFTPSKNGVTPSTMSRPAPGWEPQPEPRAPRAQTLHWVLGGVAVATVAGIVFWTVRNRGEE